MENRANTLCIFIIFVTAVVTANVFLDVNPPEINPGIHSTLSINCTFNTPDDSAMESLSLSRGNSSGQNYEKLATIMQASPNDVTLSTQEQVTATGVFNGTGDSFLYLRWEYPTTLQAGVYQCAAQGLDFFGQALEVVNISKVPYAPVDLNNVFEILGQMQNTMSSMEKFIQDLECNNSLLEDTIAELKLWRHRSIVESMTIVGRYQNKEYYVSNEGDGDINDVLDACKSYGGQLAEIDDANEYNAVQGFVRNLDTQNSGIYFLMIAGTDAESEGNWVSPTTNLTLPYTAWYKDRPSNSSTYNCLWLKWTYHWQMVDDSCYPDVSNGATRYLCEIPSL